MKNKKREKGIFHTSVFVRFVKRLTLFCVPFVVVAAVGYIGYQDHFVRQQFEGKRWALPAHVYASPLELFEGEPIEIGRVEALLDQLKYRRDAELSSQATYYRKGSELFVNTRQFQFVDKEEPARKVRIQFSGGAIKALFDLVDASSVPILRLEPVQIGSFYPALKEDRVLIKLDQAPQTLLQALFAVEDRDFYQHFGVSPKAILRATLANLRAGRVVQGGSTITAQLVKNFYLTSERSIFRKLNEIPLALILEARYSKDEILEAYLNEIYLGQDGARAIHGFGLASQYYFSRTLEELDLHHLALLVALVKGPSVYDPIKWPDRALKRRNLVLDEMASEGYIDLANAERAKAQPLDVMKDPHQAISKYPGFLDLVRRQLQQQYRTEDLTSEGLRIFTTLDVSVQDQLESAVNSVLLKLDKQTKNGGLETASLFTRRTTGEIVALVPGRDAQATGYNRALDAVRQIGSLYKPVVYLTALSDPSRYSVVTPLDDTPIRVSNPGGGAWNPKNYDNREHGIVPLHTALANSFNLATVHLGMGVGVAHTVQMLHNLGVEREVPVFPATLLGTAELTPLEVTQLYQTLANDGFVTPLRAIQAVVAQDGRILQRNGLDVRQTVDPAAVYLVNTILQEVVSAGTARSALNHIPEDFNVAGKTGTTNDLRDSWFAGFSGDYMGVVWIGRDDNQPAKLTGAQGALQIWASTMRKISREPLILEPPENIEMVWIDRENGLRASEGCETAAEFPIVKGSAPNDYSSCGAGAAPEESGENTGGWLKSLF